MADMGAQLSSELTRIIDCPYPASLSHLADLLARAPVLTVRACLRQRSPCAVTRLATHVCEALSQWAYTLRILSSLCQSPEFVDTLLSQNPGLLDALLTKANSSPRGFEEYAALCVLLLSRPLPASVPLPLSAQKFFLRVFDNARQNPDACTLKPVYLVLNGACGNLLGLLSENSREHFDQALSNMLSSKEATQNCMLMLWCIGIVLLVEHTYETVEQQKFQLSMDITSTTPKKQWRTASGRKMFGDDSKISKTINLSNVNVIFATKGDVGVLDEDAIEGIRIAVRTLRCVDQAILREWPRSSILARSTFKKLPDKILRPDINPAVQLEALCFYSMVAGEGNIPSNIVAQYERCLVDVADLVHSDHLGEALLISLPIYTPQMSHSCVQLLLARVLDSCIQSVDTHSLANYTSLVEQIMTVLPRCDFFRNAILSAASSGELQGKIWKLVQFTIEEEHTTCHTFTVSLRQQMISATTALLLTLAVTTQPSGPALPAELATALIHKQRQLPQIKSQCSHEMAAIKPAVVSLLQQKSTQHTGQHLQDWRERLNSEIETHGSFQRDSIVRSVAQICQDLETRCDTVEEPLRHEKKKVQVLEQHVVELNERIVSLEVQATDDRFYSEGLEEEKNSLTKERDNFFARLNSLQAELTDAVRNADETLTRVREDFNAKELELQSTILACNDTIHTYQKDAEAQAETVKNLEHDLTQAQDEQTSLSEEIETLQYQLGDVEKKLGSELEAGRTQAEDITKLNNMKVELELQLQGTEADLEIVTIQLNELQVTHRELVQSSEDAYRDLGHKYTRDMEAATAQAQNDRVDFDLKLQEALHRGQQAENACKETQQDLQELQASIPPLEERIQELTEFCSEQEEELDELRTLRKNVLASMNLVSQPTLAKRSTSRCQTDAAGVQAHGAPREHRRRKSAIQAADSVPQDTRDAHGATNMDMENATNASFASSDPYSSQNGSTPKRPKPRPSFKVPAMHTPNTRKSMFGSRSVSKKLSPIKRSALRQMSPNRRHTTVGFAAPGSDEGNSSVLRSGRKRRVSLQEVEEAETDFEMEDFLAGTPLTPGNFVAGTGRIPDDETATEL